MITARVREELVVAIRRVCRDLGCELLEVDGEADHLHLLVLYPPNLSVSRLVHRLKGASAQHVRALGLPEVRSKLWGASFWSPSYCAVSCGGASLATIKRYIQDQRSAA